MAEPRPVDAEAQSPADVHQLDYDIEPFAYVETNEHMKAVADDTRMDILNLLMERAATVTHLAEALDKPKGTVGYHVKVLEDAGLIRVVRTGKVRAITEKYYGRVGRVIQFASMPDIDDPAWFVHDALRGIRHVEGEPFPMFSSRMARIPVEKVDEFAQRLLALTDEFMATPRGGDTMYGILVGVFPTDHPVLRHDDEGDE